MTRLIPLIVAACGLIPSANSTSAEPLPRAANPTATESVDPPLESFELHHPTKKHLTVEQLYDIKAGHRSMRENIGQFILLDVVVDIARDVPLVIVESAGRVPDDNHRRYAHLMNMSSVTSKPSVKGERLRVEGIIVNEGYGAYMIYLSQLQYLKSKGT